MTVADYIDRPHATLRQRETPETVAEMVRQALPADRIESALPLLVHVIGGSVKRFFGWSSMPTTFHKPDAAEKQVAKARELPHLFLSGATPEADDPDALDGFIDAFRRSDWGKARLIKL